SCASKGCSPTTSSPARSSSCSTACERVRGRAVSLVPSVTETLIAWGVPPVACTRFCEQPDLPHVGGTKNPDVEAIVALAPDVVVMCVEENRREDAEALERAGLAVVSLSIDSVADVAPAMRSLGRAV